MENKIKEKKKWSINKKLLMFGILPLCIILVSALTYYALFDVTVSNIQPIKVEGNLVLSFSCLSGDTCVGDVVKISNSDTKDREVLVSVLNSNASLTTGIVGEVILSQKNSLNWSEQLGEKATVKYTIVGDNFTYFTESSLVDYVLVYYPDVNSTKPWNIANAILVGDAKKKWQTRELVSLPNVGDYNKEPLEGDSYCNFENTFDDYLHCNGAKLWLMKKIDWETKSWNPTDTLFETDLISYSDNKLGTANVLVPAKGSINVYPQVTMDVHAPSGNYLIQIEVA